MVKPFKLVRVRIYLDFCVRKQPTFHVDNHGDQSQEDERANREGELPTAATASSSTVSNGCPSGRAGRLQSARLAKQCKMGWGFSSLFCAIC